MDDNNFIGVFYLVISILNFDSLQTIDFYGKPIIQL